MRMLVSSGMRARLHSPIDHRALFAGYHAAADLVGDLLLRHRRQFVESRDNRHAALLFFVCLHDFSIVADFRMARRFPWKWRSTSGQIGLRATGRQFYGLV